MTNEMGPKMMAKTIVAIIEPVGAHGGMNYYDIGLCDGLVAANIAPILYTSVPILLQTEHYFPINLFYKKIFEKAPTWLRGIHYIGGSVRSLLHAKWHGARICHLHWFYVSALEFFNLLLAKMFGMKVVITVHDVEPFISQFTNTFLAGFAYRFADHSIVHNHASKVVLKKIYNLPDKKISIIKHGNYLHVVKPLPSPVDARKQLNIPLTAKVILFFGQIKRIKGLELLIQAFESVQKEIPDSYLVIAGRPWKDDFEFYEKKITELNITQHTRVFSRFIQDDEIPSLFSVADLVVLPYQRIYQSGVLLLTMSYGKAVLASDLDAMKEIVKDGETGYLFATEDGLALSRKIIEVLSNQESLQSVASRGLELMGNFSWVSIGHATAACYQFTLGGQK